MGLLRRMNILQELFHCRVGPGSAVLPRDVTRIHIQYSNSPLAGHLAARKFWQEYLPRLKYHNPSVSIFVDRKADKGIKAEMQIFYATQKAGQTASKPSPAELVKAGATGGPEDGKVAEQAEAETVKTLDMEFKKKERIYEELLSLTGAKEVQHTPEELAQLEEYKRLNGEKAVDRVKKRAVAEKLNAEKKMEEMARAAAAAAV